MKFSHTFDIFTGFHHSFQYCILQFSATVSQTGIMLEYNFGGLKMQDVFLLNKLNSEQLCSLISTTYLYSHLELCDKVF